MPLSAAEPSATSDEFVGPFPSWKNLKTDFGAVGDGKADDTDALQKALNSLARVGEKGESHLWIPAGTYRITRTLTLTKRAGVAVLGEHPDTTIIRWDGPAYDGQQYIPAFNSEQWKAWDGRHPAEMLWLNARNTRIGRLTFDGAGKALSGIAYKWHDTKAPDQVNSHRMYVHDMIFKDSAIGFDGGGKQCWLDSEVTMARCRFERCAQFGVGLHHFNSVDYWLWDCFFLDCGVGVSNEPMPHAGSFHVYQSVFVGSKVADATIFHTQYYAMRDNVSVRSRRFFLAKEHGSNGANITLTGNRIVDSLEADPIRLEQTANAFIANNVIQRTGPAAAEGPCIRVGLEGRTLANAVVINNRFHNVRAEAPIAVNGQAVLFNNQTITGKVEVPVPAFAGFQPNRNQKVFDVAAGADAATIQQAIDAAAAHAAANAGSRPVVHLPWGHYKIDKTLIVPANSPIQLVGDSFFPDWSGTMLMWSGAPDPEQAVIMLLKGPSKATLRNLGVVGPKDAARSKASPLKPQVVAACIRVEQADQLGARVFLQECNTNGNGVGLLVDRLDNAMVECRSHEGDGLGNSWLREWDAQVIGKDPFWPYPAIRAIGGPKTREGQTPGGGVWVYGTDTGRFQVMDGARMLVRDTWYENNSLPFYTSASGGGMLTIDTMFGANFDHPTLKGCTPTYDLADFAGRLVLINHQFARPFNKPAEEKMFGFRGACAGAQVLTLNVNEPRSFLPDLPDGVTAAHVNFHTGKKQDEQLGTIGRNDPAWASSLLAHTLDARPVALSTLPQGITDVRLFRVFTGDGRVGLHLKP